MPYTNAIFRLDYLNGSDATRSTLTGVVFSDNGSGGVRGYYVGHGLVTGAVVTVSGVTQSYGNSAWKVTRIDADNFDLDTALWASFTGADVTGNVVPFGGSSWSDAWKTITSGVTASRVAPLDTVRLAQSPAPFSIGNAKWSNGPVGSSSISFASTSNTSPIVVTRNTWPDVPIVEGDWVLITGHTVNTNANGIWQVANVTLTTLELVGSVGNGVGGSTGTIQQINCRVVHLDTAQTADVSSCNAAWTAANGATVGTTTTTRREGTAALSIARASYATDTLYAYETLAGATDFSSYQELSFNWRTSLTGLATYWKICLCSDAVGAVVVDTFIVPAMPSNSNYAAFSLTRVGGGNLGASIQSVAVYSGSVAPTANTTVFCDNIIACVSGGLNKTTLISKNSGAGFAGETWHAVQSIRGRVCILDTNTNASPTSSARGYVGTTENVPTYGRATIKPGMGTVGASTIHTLNDSGSVVGEILFSGGWDPNTDTQTGMTWLDGENGQGYHLYVAGRSYLAFEDIGIVRGYTGMYFSTSAYRCRAVRVASHNMTVSGFYFDASSFCSLEDCASVGCNSGVQTVLCNDITVRDSVVQSATAEGFRISYSDILLDACVSNNNITGVYGAFARIRSLGSEFRNNASQWVSALYASIIRLKDTTRGGSSTYTTWAEGRVYSENENDSGQFTIGTDGGAIDSVATDRPDGSGKKWRLLTSSTARTSAHPLWLEVGKVYCPANQTRTIRAWLKKAHATACDGRLVVRGGQIAGVDNDVTATLANNTNWQQLSISFTPTESGVVEVEVWAEYVSSHQYVDYDQGLEVL